MKHTKGPWIYINNEIEAQGSEVCSLNYTEVDAETRANANLIAAAPDLLEALEKWQQFMIDNYKPEDISWFDATIDAIKKAKGEV